MQLSTRILGNRGRAFGHSEVVIKVREWLEDEHVMKALLSSRETLGDLVMVHSNVHLLSAQGLGYTIQWLMKHRLGRRSILRHELQALRNRRKAKDLLREVREWAQTQTAKVTLS